MKTSEVRIESRDGTSYGTKVTIDGVDRHDISALEPPRGLPLDPEGDGTALRRATRQPVRGRLDTPIVEGRYEVGLSGASQAWLKSLGWTAPDEA